MKNTIARIIFILTIAALLYGCGFSQPEQLKIISANELNSLMNQGDILLIDVHIPEQQHIAGTDAQIPFNQIDDHLDQFPEDKNSPIYLYCKSGPMGNWAARSLFEQGYSQVYNLEGGMDAWNALGLAVEKAP
jgi:rhodanese-related sulfurtransferase